QCGWGDDFAEWQADRPGRTEGAGADDSVHFGRLPDCGAQGAPGAGRPSLPHHGALPLALQCEQLAASPVLDALIHFVPELGEIADRRNQREKNHAPHQRHADGPEGRVAYASGGGNLAKSETANSRPMINTAIQPGST